jgi:hypothetical protein
VAQQVVDVDALATVVTTVFSHVWIKPPMPLITLT